MIDGVSSATTVSMGDSSSTTSTTEELGKDDFLLLLVTQLQNQDPLNPTDNTEFVSQLAQFSSLEGIKNMEETMGTVADGISDMQKWSLSDLIDNTVKFESSSFDFSGEPVSIEYSLGSNAASATVSIYDASGNLIKSVDAVSLNSGTYELQWDRLDARADGPQHLRNITSPAQCAPRSTLKMRERQGNERHLRLGRH